MPRVEAKHVSYCRRWCVFPSVVVLGLVVTGIVHAIEGGREVLFKLGGAKDLATVPFDAMSGPTESYSGCIRNLHVNNIPLPLEPQNIREGRNVGACGGAACAGGRCRRDACPGACAAPARCRRARCLCAAGRAGDRCQHEINVTIPHFDGDSLIAMGKHHVNRQVGEQRLTSVPTYITLNFTTSEPDGLLLWIDMDIDHLGFGLENGYLRLTWSLHCNAPHRIVRPAEKSFPILPRKFSRILPNSGFLADGEWHKCILEFGRKNITLTVDKQLVFVEESCLREEVTSNNVEMYVGGVNEEDNLAAKKLFPQNFKGCIDHISTREGSYISNYSEVYSENVKSCQIFPTIL